MHADAAYHTPQSGRVEYHRADALPLDGDGNLMASVLSVLPEIEDGLGPIATSAEFKSRLALAQRALAANTRTAYLSHIRQFVVWCRAHSLSPLPAEPATICSFLEKLSQGHRMPTIDTTLGAISWLHVMVARMPDPTLDPDVRILHGALAREIGRLKRQKAALTVDQLNQILEMLDGQDNHPETLRDIAILCVANETMMRRSELVLMRVSQVLRSEDGSGTVFIPKSKGDQEQLGRNCWISGDTMARIEIYKQSLAGRGMRLSPEDYLWRRFDRRRSALDRQPGGPLASFSGDRPTNDPGQPIAMIVKRACSLVGLDPKLFAGHSSRIGTTQDLLVLGEEPMRIQLLAGWKSPSTISYYVRKLAPGRSVMAEAYGKLGRKRLKS